MSKPLLALAALALPATLAAQSPTPAPQRAQWTLAGGDQGCAVHASAPGGTVVSILAGTGQDKLVFLVQNRGFTLEDGRSYPIAVQFDAQGAWQMQAVARTRIDEDGPGLMFTVPHGDKRGLAFLSQFVAASGMQVRSEGRALTSLPLGTGETAMTALARCMSGAEPTTIEATFEGGGPAVKI